MPTPERRYFNFNSAKQPAQGVIKKGCLSRPNGEGMRVNRNINLGIDALGKGASAPSAVTINNTYGWKFAVNNNGFVEPFEIAYDCDETENIEFKIHWYSTNATAGRYIKFQLDYNVTEEDAENLNAAGHTQDTGEILMSTVAYRLQETTIIMPAANFNQDDIVSMLFTRIASVGTAPANPADNPVVISLEIEYISNKLGETI